MAGERFDLSIFRRVVSDQLTLDHLELFPIQHDADPETLPRVTLFRTADLVNLRLAFRGLVLLDSPDGRVLRRADNATTGLISVLFGGQHLHEEAFFEVSTGIEVETPGSFTEDPKRPRDPRDATRGSETPTPPPVRARIAGHTRLVFRVRDEVIPFTRDGLLAALTALPLNVVPHAARGSRQILVLGPAMGLQEVLGLNGLGVTRVSGAVLAAGRTLSAAANLDARFGSTAAANALVAAHAGSGTFRLSEEAVRQLEGLLADRFAVPAARPPVPREPSPTETAVELPWRLQLSPHPDAAFTHASAPAVSADGRVELWHTRLASRSEQGVTERPKDDRTVRAVWARDFEETSGFGFHPAPLAQPAEQPGPDDAGARELELPPQPAQSRAVRAPVGGGRPADAVQPRRLAGQQLRDPAAGRQYHDPGVGAPRRAGPGQLRQGGLRRFPAALPAAGVLGQGDRTQG